jgi:hypothetical protein
MTGYKLKNKEMFYNDHEEKYSHSGCSPYSNLPKYKKD